MPMAWPLGRNVRAVSCPGKSEAIVLPPVQERKETNTFLSICLVFPKGSVRKRRAELSCLFHFDDRLLYDRMERERDGWPVARRQPGQSEKAQSSFLHCLLTDSDISGI